MKQNFLFLPTITLLLLLFASCEEKKPDIYNFEVTENKLSFNADGTGDKNTFDITSDTEWMIVPADTWVKVDKNEGKGNAVIKVSVEENTTFEIRNSSISFKSPKGLFTETSIEITQLGQGVALEVTVEELHFNVDGTSENNKFEILSNVDWVIKPAAEWIEVDKSDGKGGAQIAVSVQANESDAARNSSIMISSPDNHFKSVEIKISQLGINIFSMIPDASFRGYCKRFDLNSDGVLTISEAEKVEVVDVFYDKDENGEYLVLDNIESVKGIEYFKNVKKIMLHGNKITEIDLSNFALLEEIDCNQNYLSSIDVSANRNLKQLWLEGNKVTSIDVTHNTLLESLAIADNPIKKIDLSKNHKLKIIYFQNCGLEALDISHCLDMERIYGTNNFLKELDLSSMTKLVEVYCANNQIEKLDVSKSPTLYGLNFNNNKVSKIDVTNNIHLEELCCSDNPIDAIDIRNSPFFRGLECANTKVKELDLSRNLNTSKLICNNNPDLTVIYVWDNFIHENYHFKNLEYDIDRVKFVKISDKPATN